MWNLAAGARGDLGLPHVSLHASAGSHGELAGVLLTRAYHEAKVSTATRCSRPDTATGRTARDSDDGQSRRVREARHHPDGGVDLRSAAREGRLRCGVPDASRTRTRSACSTRHPGDRCDPCTEWAATLYYDGANLNAVMGISRPGGHGLSDNRPLQPAQVLHPAPRRRRPRAQARSRCPTVSRLSCATLVVRREDGINHGARAPL